MYITAEVHEKQLSYRKLRFYLLIKLSKMLHFSASNATQMFGLLWSLLNLKCIHWFFLNQDRIHNSAFRSFMHWSAELLQNGYIWLKDIIWISFVSSAPPLKPVRSLLFKINWDKKNEVNLLYGQYFKCVIFLFSSPAYLVLLIFWEIKKNPIILWIMFHKLIE